MIISVCDKESPNFCDELHFIETAITYMATSSVGNVR